MRRSHKWASYGCKIAEGDSVVRSRDYGTPLRLPTSPITSRWDRHQFHVRRLFRFADNICADIKGSIHYRNYRCVNSRKNGIQYASAKIFGTFQHLFMNNFESAALFMTVFQLNSDRFSSDYRDWRVWGKSARMRIHELALLLEVNDSKRIPYDIDQLSVASIIYSITNNY